jgi:hypothetical protein
LFSQLNTCKFLCRIMISHFGLPMLDNNIYPVDHRLSTNTQISSLGTNNHCHQRSIRRHYLKWILCNLVFTVNYLRLILYQYKFMNQTRYKASYLMMLATLTKHLLDIQPNEIYSTGSTRSSIFWCVIKYRCKFDLLTYLTSIF